MSSTDVFGTEPAGPIPMGFTSGTSSTESSLNMSSTNFCGAAGSGFGSAGLASDTSLSES
eukprot:CAMPEP_0177275056 /NCGR_PEP_ID=MMETSP0367-20130122/67507_1 /TAXON_ID=447022 ORGANISM="Scrippsiella hangoei-like, Strain SHHI-4" /NCGR_SAMPLE_ID=MMETSP0367 /ASSEMBLY_ACC=CAM_ASM_000362 /LENGTH=59 /DNA_ID=CAMNT_0018731453 /DNA_START=25 /DNA_END=201 /DNA_ORIENTATION=-